MPNEIVKLVRYRPAAHWEDKKPTKRPTIVQRRQPGSNIKRHELMKMLQDE